jgi:hypothetical protein
MLLVTPAELQDKYCHRQLLSFAPRTIPFRQKGCLLFLKLTASSAGLVQRNAFCTTCKTGVTGKEGVLNTMMFWNCLAEIGSCVTYVLTIKYLDSM